MKFEWTYEQESPLMLRTFLKDQGISRGLLAKIKFQGGEIRVNDTVQNVLVYLTAGDHISVRIPDEGEHETLVPEHEPLDIVFEDEHFLVVNKPSGVASIPAQYHPNGTMAHRVKGYYVRQGYVNQIVHVVTRLDRDTTGLMLFAKHGYAHAMMDKQLQARTIHKYYQALVSNIHAKQLSGDGDILLPIMRDETSIIKRKTGQEGLFAHTEYHVLQEDERFSLVMIQLHTGRTHQIRVHFSAIGHPLLGDDMYGGRMDVGMERQALHCAKLVFNHPFTKENIELEQALPRDMQQLL
ncbi:RluA family pseudouridine synthase [Vagococcus xieshaowenii]|uniref:Pseudouridine synthase n=1 Tax=Vagococcus xieshaowenii TaxID=2562451 RepID=A0A4Z0D8I3_9ENTE|nr:RluA family pseudouridine synthase [Vagococcus xieshaowenii]QCA28009.1 RluA family pseudouridine synthase [Vagococcus xieshaowenii]TFZ41224.1 RluA family pseudouridine synthase [Vagococcus xieshaowenii]